MKMNLFVSVFIALFVCLGAKGQTYDIQEKHVPSGWIGDYFAISFSEYNFDDFHSSPTSVKITYNYSKQPPANETRRGYAGIYWNSNNWGKYPGNDLSSIQYKRCTFWAKGNKGREVVLFGCGGINMKNREGYNSQLEYSDKFYASKKVILTNEWEQYSIPFSAEDFSCVIGGFFWSASAADNIHIGNEVTFSLDDIQYDTADNMVDSIDEAEWKLVWNDEFDYSILDADNWSIDVSTGGGNDELQYYTNRKDNIFIENGILHIVAKKEKYTYNQETRAYTSAKITTKEKRSWKYGRFDIKAQLPTGKGVWPAIWLLPEKKEYGEWASSGEIDIIEYNGAKKDHLFASTHFGGVWPKNKNSTVEYIVNKTSVTTGFHVFSIIWDEMAIYWYLDGIKYAQQNTWYSDRSPFPAPFDKEFYLIINLAIGGSFVGDPDDTTVLPQALQIESIKVYDKINE